MQWRQGTDQAGEKLSRPGLAVSILSSVPNRDFVDLQIRDRVYLLAHQVRQLLGDQHVLRAAFATASIDQVAEAGGLLGQDCLRSVGFREQSGFEPFCLGFFDKKKSVSFGLFYRTLAIGRSLL